MPLLRFALGVLFLVSSSGTHAQPLLDPPPEPTTPYFLQQPDDNPEPKITTPCLKEAGDCDQYQSTIIDTLFPSWYGESKVQGVIGTNDDGKFLLNYIPKLINIVLLAVAPIVVGLFIFAGLRFVYAGDNEEQIQESKKFFGFALMGILFIVLSFSLMKAIFFIISG
jgi:hypothetical protein